MKNTTGISTVGLVNLLSNDITYFESVVDHFNAECLELHAGAGLLLPLEQRVASRFLKYTDIKKQSQQSLLPET